MAGSKTEKMRKLFASKALDVEELDGVAGGTRHETADDSRFLNVLLQGASRPMRSVRRDQSQLWVRLHFTPSRGGEGLGQHRSQDADQEGRR